MRDHEANAFVIIAIFVLFNSLAGCNRNSLVDPNECLFQDDQSALDEDTGVSRRLTRTVSIELLKSSSRFTTGLLGPEGRVPKEIVALISLAEEKDAKAIFLKFCRSKNVYTQLYGLCGTYYVSDIGEFKDMVNNFRPSKQSALVVSADYGSMVSVDVLIHGPPRNQHNASAEDGVVYYDIASGALPKYMASIVNLHEQAY